MLIPFDYLIEQLCKAEQENPEAKLTPRFIRKWLYRVLCERGIPCKGKAKWIYEKGEYNMIKGEDGFMTGVEIKAQGMICSHCDNFFSVALLNALSYDYCPYCGYKMDLEEIEREVEKLGIPRAN